MVDEALECALSAAMTARLCAAEARPVLLQVGLPGAGWRDPLAGELAQGTMQGITLLAEPGQVVGTGLPVAHGRLGPALGWDVLLHRHALPTVDLLRIHDAHAASDVLSAMEASQARPSMIRISAESASPDIVPAAAAWLRGRGYEAQLRDGWLVATRQAGAAGDGLLHFARDFARQGQRADAIRLLRLLRNAQPADAALRQALAELLVEEGDLPGAIAACPADLPLAAELIGQAAEAFNAARQSGELAQAERHAAAIAEARPAHSQALECAMGCNQALGQTARAVHFAGKLVALQPGHIAAHAVLLDHHAAGLGRDGELASRLRLALAPPGQLHPIRRLHEIHRALSLLLAEPLGPLEADAVRRLVCAARGVDPDALEDPGLRLWARHYHCLAEAADDALLAVTAGSAPPHDDLAFVTAAGQPLSWAQLRRRRSLREAEAIFLVAADERYLRLYGPSYLRSVLTQADVPALVFVHVIGGAERLQPLAEFLAIDDARVLLSGDDFDPAAITTSCHDSDGPKALPLAHLQSVRFAMAERLLAAIGRPVLVSDIDALLQRGVRDLIERADEADVVLNRNAESGSFGSHLTANLALFFPTPGGRAFAADLRAYLDEALAREHVTRWIDQCALQMAWQKHAASGQTRFGWFDTASDINNVMYRSFVPNGFRFLSLFHGFDMASLPAPAVARPAARKRRGALVAAPSGASRSYPSGY